MTVQGYIHSAQNSARNMDLSSLTVASFDHHPPDWQPLSTSTLDSSSLGHSDSLPQEEEDLHYHGINDDDDHNDPNLWEPIQNDSRPPIKVHIPPMVCDCVSLFRDWTFAAVDIWVEVLSAPPFPLDTLQKVSIILLGMERIRDNLEKSTLLVLETNNASGSNNGAWMLPQYLVWGIPGMLALLSVSFVLTLQLSWGQQEEAVIATALILLIFLEALLPLFILGCTSMFLFQQVSWETGLILLVVVWLGSTFCAHCIRRVLYQSLGHG